MFFLDDYIFLMRATFTIETVSNTIEIRYIYRPEIIVCLFLWYNDRDPCVCVIVYI